MLTRPVDPIAPTEFTVIAVLRGKGIKGVRSSYAGDLFCHVRVEIPVRLTEKQKKLLRDLDHSLKEGGAKHSPQARSFMERMKGFFATE